MQRCLLALTLAVACGFVAADLSSWTPPSHWTKGADAAQDAPVKFYLGLRVNQQALDAAYHRVTDFTSPSRGAYLSVDELADEIAPSAAATQQALDWLAGHGIGSSSVFPSLSKDVLTVIAPVSAVERAFNVKMSHWTHSLSGRTTVRAGTAVGVPQELSSVVDVIVGLGDFFESKEEQGMVRRAASATGKVYNSPYIAAINGNTTQAQLQFSVFCLNGARTNSATAPCSDVPGQPIAKAFTLLVTPAGSPTKTYTFAADPATCASSSFRPSVTCGFDVTLPEWVETTFNLTTMFSNGQASQSYISNPYRPRPPTTPMSLHDLYSIPHEYRVATNKSNSQAVVSFEQQYWSMSDLRKFWDMFGIAPNPPHLVGFNNGSMPGGESTLDVQMITGLGQGVNTTTWSFPVGDYIMNWAWAVGNNSLAPLVTSISYGDTESGYKNKAGYGLAYIDRMNVELQKMAVRGLTVFAGSGDAGWTNVGEMGNDLSQPDKTCGIMRAFYPSESPYVTSMSASFVMEGGEAVISVRGGRSWTTGGGFSNYTAVQEWQKEAVQGYLNSEATQLPLSSMFNRGGRGYADLAAVGDNNICIWNGAVFPLGGTSASGPIMAGIVSLLNDVLLNNNKPVVGHFNPTVYRWHASTPTAFNDIVVGRNNDGDNQPPGSSYPIFCEHGFPAAQGWDPASGLGSPRFDQWVLMALQE